MAIYDNWPPGILLPRGSNRLLHLYMWWMNLPDHVKNVRLKCNYLIENKKEDEIFNVIREDYKKRTGQYYKYYI